MAVLYTNNATTTLSAGITSGQTTLTVAAASGALFPSLSAPDIFYATLVDPSNNVEIVKVTARSTDTFTIVRAQEGTTARAYSSGDKVELRVTAAGLANKLDKDTGGALAGKLTTVAPAAGAAGLNLPHGTAPTSPTNGDVWSTSSGLFARVNGVTVGPLSMPDDTAYGAGWNASIVAPTQNSVYDQMELRAPLASPTLTGSPTAPTQAEGDNSTKLATTAYVDRLKGLPDNSGGAVTLNIGHRGELYRATGAVTCPSAVFAAGDLVVVYNNSASSIPITQGASVTMRLSGTATTGSRTLAPRGVANVMYVSSSECVVSGDVS